MKYSIWITALKFLLGAIGGTIYAPLVQWLLDGIQNNNWTMNPDAQALTITLISAAAAGLYAAGKNWWNNYALPRMDRIKFMKMLAIGGACGLLIGTQGCVGLGMPSALGKPAEMYSEIKTQMPPEVDPVTGAVTPGESYSYISKKKLPAGTDLEGQDNLDIGIDPDGSWHIRQGQTAGFSSQGQLGGIKDYITTNAQVQSQAIDTGKEWGKLFAAFSGQKLEFDAVDEARDDANSMAALRDVLEYLKGLEARMKRIESRPATPPADSPGADLPEVGNN